jgi:hypothetical protein
MRYLATLGGIAGRRCICGGDLHETLPPADRQAELAKLLDSDEPLESLRPKIERLLHRQ